MLVWYAQHRPDWWREWERLGGTAATLAAWPSTAVVSAAMLDCRPSPEDGRVGPLSLPPSLLVVAAGDNETARHRLVGQLLAQFARAHTTGTLLSWGRRHLGSGKRKRLDAAVWLQAHRIAQAIWARALKRHRR